MHIFKIHLDYINILWSRLCKIIIYRFFSDTILVLYVLCINSVLATITNYLHILLFLEVKLKHAKS